MLQVSTETVKRWTRRGDLVGIHLGYRTLRYRLADVEALMKRRADRDEDDAG